MPSCAKCGYITPDSSSFCQTCGNALGPGSSSQTFPNISIPQTPVSNRGLSDAQKAIIVVAVVLVVVIVGGVMAVSYFQTLSSISRAPTPPSSSSPIVITGVNAQISYANPSANYFGPQSQSLGGTGLPLQLSYGQSFYYSFSLRMGGFYESHTIESVSLSTPGFTFLSTNPALPYSMNSGSSVTVTITAQAPSQNYYGAITIVVTTQ
jgi:hypothetical protein